MYTYVNICTCVYTLSTKKSPNLIYLQYLPKLIKMFWKQEQIKVFFPLSWSNTEVRKLACFFLWEQGAPHSLHASQRMNQFPVG